MERIGSKKIGVKEAKTAKIYVITRTIVKIRRETKLNGINTAQIGIKGLKVDRVFIGYSKGAAKYILNILEETIIKNKDLSTKKIKVRSLNNVEMSILYIIFFMIFLIFDNFINVMHLN